MMLRIHHQLIICSSSAHRQLTISSSSDHEKDDKLYIGADKTTNFYKMDKDSYSELLKKNVTNDYKKAPSDTVDKTNKKQIEIVAKLDLDDRVFATQKKDAYVTIKDHKENYLNDTKCRLLNPT